LFRVQEGGRKKQPALGPDLILREDGGEPHMRTEKKKKKKS